MSISPIRLQSDLLAEEIKVLNKLLISRNAQSRDQGAVFRAAIANWRKNKSEVNEKLWQQELTKLSTIRKESNKLRIKIRHLRSKLLKS